MYFSWASSTCSLPSRFWPLGEDIEDQLGPVDDFDLRAIGDGADLGRVELLVENDQAGTPMKRQDGKLIQLAAAHEETGVGFPALLQDRVDGADAGRVGQLLEFVKGRDGLLASSGEDTDQERAFGAGRLAHVEFFAGQLRLEGLDQPRQSISGRNSGTGGMTW